MAEAGQYFEYDDYWRDREDKKRSATDKKYLFAFLMFVLLWIGIAIHAVNTAPILGTIPIHMGEAEQALHDGRGVIMSFVWVAIWLLALYLLILHHLTKYMIYLTFFMATLIMGAMFIPLFSGPTPLFLVLPIWAISLTMYFLMLYTMNKVGTPVVSKIIQDSIKAMTSFPLSFLVAIMGIILIAAVILFTVLVVVCLLAIKESMTVVVTNWIQNEYNSEISRSNDTREFTPTYIYILLPIFACCSLWIVFFLNHIVRMILHGIFTSWHRTPDKKTISAFTTLRYSAIAVRYHAGSLAFGSTIFTKIQMLRVIWNLRMDIVMEVRKRPVVILCLPIVMWNSTINALVACIVHAKNFHQSMKHAFSLKLRSPFKYVATRLMTQWMLVFGVLIVPLISVALPFAYLQASGAEYEPKTVMAVLLVVGKTALILTLSVIVVFNSAIEAVTFCYLEECKSNEVDDEKHLTDGPEVSHKV